VYSGRHNNESLKEKIIGAVYTKYLTLPERVGRTTPFSSSAMSSAPAIP
jgi:hypothetical protein